MNRYDILECEALLREQILRILPCTSHALYFPRLNRPQDPVWLPEENRLLLPLWREQELLGVLVQRGLDPARVEALLPSLPAIVSLCLDNIALYKSGRQDTLTGLLTRDVLVESLNREADAIRSAFENAADGTEHGKAAGGSFGLIAIRFDGMDAVVRKNGYVFSESLIAKMAEALRDAVPKEALCARSGEHEFAALIPGGERTLCEQIALAAVHRLQEVMLPAPYTDRLTGVTPHAGYTLFPQDMDGTRLRDMTEPAATLLRKAKLAADAVRPQLAQRERVMGYGQILSEGGRVRRILPLSCIEISLGRGEGAREGQSFSVWSRTGNEEDPLYKGDIVLQDVRESASIAEVLHLGDASRPIQPGDVLVLLPTGRGELLPPLSDDLPENNLADSGLYRHRDFLAHLARAREGCSSFALALLRIPHQKRGQETSLKAVVRVCKDAFQKAGLKNVLGGVFALNSLIFFHPNVTSDTVKAVYERLYTELNALTGFNAQDTDSSMSKTVVGLAIWPFLHYHPGEMVECARKALDYALLLPAPHIGIFDSVAINISADKKHCRGDVFGAVEEYKIALLADPSNTLARNSLGVCMAGLGRYDNARRQFEKALHHSPKNAALTYNLGAVCLRLGEIEMARKHFLRCLELDSSHLYAALRLGQIAEQQDQLDDAQAVYLAAAQKNAVSGLPYRHLARLALRTGNPIAAREHLHTALLRDPRDAEALSMMARLYLDGGEDAELAESLARQSVALRPDRKSGWLELSRALTARGHDREAREALLKAESL